MPKSLYSLVQGVNPATVEHISIDNSNFLYSCGYPVHCGGAYLFAHDQSFKSLSHYVQDVFPTEGALADAARITFVDASGRNANASGRWASLMRMLGFLTANGGGAPRQVATQVIDNSGGRDTLAADWLAEYFGVSVTTPPAATAGTTPTAIPTASASSGGITVVLGSAEEQAFLGDPGIGS